MQKYRLGFPIREFAHELPPKKTIRGCALNAYFFLVGSFTDVIKPQLGTQSTERKADTLSSNKG